LRNTPAGRISWNFSHYLAFIIFAGNGRPFAMEVLDPKIISPSRELLVKIQNIINRGEGLNAAKDVEVALLTQVYKCLCSCVYCCVCALLTCVVQSRASGIKCRVLLFTNLAHAHLAHLRRNAARGRRCRRKPRRSGRVTPAWCGASARSPGRC